MADIKDCSKINAVKDRMDCIEKNLALVNSALEAVAKELRSAIPPGLSKRLEDLEKETVKYGDVLQLQSFDPTKNDTRNQCLTYVTDDGDTKTVTCGAAALYAQGWKIRRPTA